MEKYTTRTTCRVCGSKELVPLFSLGEQYVSGFIDADQRSEDVGHKVPIDIELCKVCTLVQAKHTAPQELLYRRHYWYRSGVTQTMRDALEDVVHDAISIVQPSQLDIVLDIGSNDGTLLRNYPDNIATVGVEPAENLAGTGSQGVDMFINDFWSAKVYKSRVPYKAKIITAIGMFYDLEDPNQFIADVAEVLAPNGLFVAQLMCLWNMLSINDIGNLAHEHLEFYSIKSLKHLLYKHGLEVFDVRQNSVNGQSYRLYIRHIGSSVGKGLANIDRLRIAESKDKELSNPEFYSGLFERMEANRQATYEFVLQAVKDGKPVWIYGASTKGNVILQYYGLDNTLIQGASDRSPEKWGKKTIGTEIPIFSEIEAREHNPDYFLVLPYAFLDEFIEREHDWWMSGGKFIVPLPNLRIV